MVEDVDGNRFLDFMAGIAVASTGYGHPKVVHAVQEAASKFLHICGSDFYYESFAALCERLAQLAPGTSKKRVFLTNSGTEAVEGAIKLARHSTGRPAIIGFLGAFHGRTYGALSATPQESKQAPFAPLVPGFRVVPKDPRALDSAVDSHTAAVMLEPIQGETGINVLDDELLHAAREACDREGAALIFDEIQCGMGRTGSLWAYQQADVVPGPVAPRPPLAVARDPADHQPARIREQIGEPEPLQHAGAEGLDEHV